MYSKITSIFIFLIFVCGCAQKSDTPIANNVTLSTHIYPSVPTIEDEYIPILHTNVFMRTDDDALADEVEKDLIHYHKLFDQYHYYYDDGESSVVKNLKIANEYFGSGNEIQLDDELCDLIFESMEIMRLTDGYFNIFLNPVLDLYDGKFSAFPIENTDPDEKKIAEALGRVPSYEEAARLFSRTNNNISADSTSEKSLAVNLGGIAKGYVAQKIYDAHKGKTFLLNLGNSSLIASGRTYRVGVVSPYNKTQALVQVELPDGFALSTSSTTNNYYILADDARTIRCHIIDPHTGYSDDSYWSVTVVSDNAAVADALSTALFNVGNESQVSSIVSAAKNRYGCVFEVCFVKEESREKERVSLLISDGFEKFLLSENLSANIDAVRVLQ